MKEKERWSGASTKFEDEELETLLNEDPRQTLKELSKSKLNVDESIVNKRLKALGLNHACFETRSTICELLFQRQSKGSHFCIDNGDEKWIHYII